MTAWSLMAGFVFLFLGFETMDRSIEEIDAQLLQLPAAKVRAT